MRFTCTCYGWQCLLFLSVSLASTAQSQASQASSLEDLWAHFVRNSRHQDCGSCSTEPSLAWVQAYTRCHSQQLHAPSKAKFLLYLCGQPTWEGASAEARNTSFPGACLGMGDRLRGMIEMIRLAAYANRVLLFYWSHPLKLEDALEPNHIDWRVKPEYNLDISHAPYYLSLKATPPELADGSWRERHKDKQVVIVRMSQHDHHGTSLYPHEPYFGWPPARAHIYRTLFKPSKGVEERAMLLQQQLFGSNSKPYVGVHLRLGGLMGEQQAIHRFEQFKGFLSSLVCARVLATAANITDTPVLVITDNILLRELIAEKYFHGVVGPPMDMMPTHLDSGNEAGLDSHLSSFVDLVLLSRATAFLASPSGFSNVAMYLGHSTYVATVAKCIDTVTKLKPAHGLLGHAT